MTNSIAKLVLVLCCLSLTNVAKSNALLLANIIHGCNTFACRLTTVENDVAQLKQQMNRINPSTANTYNHNPGYSSNSNQFQQGGYPDSNLQKQPQQQPQQQQQLPNQQQLNNQPTNNQQTNNQSGPGNQPTQPSSQPQSPASQQNVRGINNYGGLYDDPYSTPYRRASNYPNNQFYRRA